MSKHSFRYTMTKKAQEDGKCYIAYIMDDFGNDVRVNTSKVNHFLADIGKLFIYTGFNINEPE